MLKTILATVVFATAASGPCYAVTNLLTNPGFEDSDNDTNFGDGWGAFGAAGFNNFFGPNGHSSFFPDTVGNTGGVFQSGIAASEGSTYQFDLLNTRLESNFDADLRFGIEFYAADDMTKLGESLTLINASERLALPNVDGSGSVNGAVFSTKAVAPVGTSIARPVILFDNVNPTYLTQSQTGVFVFDSYFSQVPAAGGNLLKNPDFEIDENSDGNFGDAWGSFGNTGFNDFFDGNLHGSIFADTAGNEGGFFQQSIIGEVGTSYEFSLTDVRLEANFDARIRIGLEYYASDDFTLLGSDIVEIDTSSVGDGLSFTTSGSAVAGTSFVRPVILFDQVNPLYLTETNASAFIFATALSEVTPGLSGDYNGDGTVDAADYTVWRDNVGGDGSEFAVGSRDPLLAGQVIGSGDYGFWSQNYGTTSSSASAASVPEPSSFVLLCLTALIGPTFLKSR